jgi:hypothetical protein
VQSTWAGVSQQLQRKPNQKLFGEFEGHNWQRTVRNGRQTYSWEIFFVSEGLHSAHWMRGVSLVSFSGTTESFSFFKKALAY